MPFHPNDIANALKALVSVFVVCSMISLADCRLACGQLDEGNPRLTPLVRAVAATRPAVVNLRGKKTLSNGTPHNGRTQAVRQVNGMGTGIIIDPAGFILTNFHVVKDVKQIQVTLHDGTTTTGQLIAHDHPTDLALLKIRSVSKLPTIPLGTSTDVMLAETVAALGNAYGYEDTVTRGIVSEIGRTVQVSDKQVYHNLIQTDAAINPGNSGGPLINLDGKMIGINVAVRVGAQGIAFAIPVNDAIEIAGQFLHDITEKSVRHGIIAKTVYHANQPSVQIQSVLDNSAAESAGLKFGDVIKEIDGQAVKRSIDFHRGILNKKPKDEISILVDRHGQSKEFAITLAPSRRLDSDTVWQRLGVKVMPLQKSQLRGIHPNYDRGLRITKVRPTSPAAKEGMRRGDILVAMHGWKTETVENLQYVLERSDVRRGNECVFYIIRDKEPFYGNIQAGEN